MHSLTPPREVGEATSVEITPQGDENMPPPNDSDLKRGKALPPLSSQSTITFLVSKLHNSLVDYTEEHIPEELRSLSAEEWTNSDFLKRHFKAPGKKG